MTSRASPASVAGGGEDSQRPWGPRGSCTDVVAVREPLGCCSVGMPPVAPWQSQPYRGREALSSVGMCSCSMGWPVLQRGGLCFWLDNIWGCLQLVTHSHTLAIIITLSVAFPSVCKVKARQKCVDWTLNYAFSMFWLRFFFRLYYMKWLNLE